MNFFLLISALILFVLIAPIAFVYAIVVHILRGLSDYFWIIALSIDQTGNAICARMFNDILIKKGGHQFGNPDETISHVLGKNYETNTLYAIGKVVSWLLNKIENNHVQKAAKTEQ